MKADKVNTMCIIGLTLLVDIYCIGVMIQDISNEFAVTIILLGLSAFGLCIYRFIDYKMRRIIATKDFVYIRNWRGHSHKLSYEEISAVRVTGVRWGSIVYLETGEGTVVKLSCFDENYDELMKILSTKIPNAFAWQ